MNLKYFISTKLQKIEKIFHSFSATNNLKSNESSPRLIPIDFKPLKAINNIEMISDNQMEYPLTKINNLFRRFSLLLFLNNLHPPILQLLPKLGILILNNCLYLNSLISLINLIIMTNLSGCRNFPLNLFIFFYLASFQNNRIFPRPTSLSFWNFKNLLNFGNYFYFFNLLYFLFIF